MTMRVRCPCCHADYTIDQAVEDEAARELMGLLSDLPREASRPLAAYLGLFRAKSRALAWDEELDTPRLAAAFRRLTQRLSRWPAPRELMEHLPSRPKPAALPSPPISDEQRARNRERIAEMISSLGLGK